MAHHPRSSLRPGWLRPSLAALAIVAIAVLPIASRPISSFAAASSPAVSGWSVLTTQNVGPFANKFAAVDAFTPSDAWAVGCSFDTNANCHALTEHWDGSAWSVVSTPAVTGAVSTELLGVSGDSSTDVWAVGDFFTQTNGGAFILHWNGSAWSRVAGARGGIGGLQAVSAISPSDAWAVGGSNLIEHWDGHAWSVVAAPATGLHGGDLQGVTAISSTDVWAVGSSFDSKFRSHSVILHWDGTSWSVSPSPKTGPSSSLVGVSAASANDVWAVGQDFPSSTATLIEHWNGASWSVVPGPNVPVSKLTGVAAVSSTDVWAVGSSTVAGGPTGNTTQTLAEQWNGTKWTVSATPTASFTASEFGADDGLEGGAVSATSTTIFAVGSFVDAKNNQRTLAESHAA
jgi:hypothetical protein